MILLIEHVNPLRIIKFCERFAPPSILKIIKYLFTSLYMHFIKIKKNSRLYQVVDGRNTISTLLAKERHNNVYLTSMASILH